MHYPGGFTVNEHQQQPLMRSDDGLIAVRTYNRLAAFRDVLIIIWLGTAILGTVIVIVMVLAGGSALLGGVAGECDVQTGVGC